MVSQPTLRMQDVSLGADGRGQLGGVLWERSGGQRLGLVRRGQAPLGRRFGLGVFRGENDMSPCFRHTYLSSIFWVPCNEGHLTCFCIEGT